jgi:glycosyltransferase involved in cell wall biosynthesis
MAPTVVFVQRYLAHFRVPLFEGLREALASDGVRMRLLVGVGSPEEQAKGDGAEITWAEPIPTKYFAGHRLVWMPIRAALGPGDLLVIEQANKFVWNLWELLKPRVYRLALWGHGRNLQAENPNSLRERFKRFTTMRADWWFAYTETSRQILLDSGCDGYRITVCNNAIDTGETVRHRASLTHTEIATLAAKLGVAGKPVGLFLGSLYSAKGLDLCFAAALAIRRKLPEFEWLIIGDGPDRPKLDAIAREHSWIHCVGARIGREKVLFASLADVLMMPSAVGLAALDSLALGLPIVTMRDQRHGPEVSYLTDGVDSLQTAPDIESFAATLVALLGDRKRLSAMQDQCLRKATTYRIEDMVRRMHEGVKSALQFSE